MEKLYSLKLQGWKALIQDDMTGESFVEMVAPRDASAEWIVAKLLRLAAEKVATDKGRNLVILTSDVLSDFDEFRREWNRRIVQYKVLTDLVERKVGNHKVKKTVIEVYDIRQGVSSQIGYEEIWEDDPTPMFRAMAELYHRILRNSHDTIDPIHLLEAFFECVAKEAVLQAKLAGEPK